MAREFASGKHAVGICDRCGQRAKLTALRKQIVKGLLTNLKVCWQCMDKDHPQLMLGTVDMSDPQALKEARPDSTAADSRSIQWGWAPVGGSTGTSGVTPNALLVNVQVGNVTIVVT